MLNTTYSPTVNNAISGLSGLACLCLRACWRKVTLQSKLMIEYDL